MSDLVYDPIWFGHRFRIDSVAEVRITSSWVGFFHPVYAVRVAGQRTIHFKQLRGVEFIDFYADFPGGGTCLLKREHSATGAL